MGLSNVICHYNVVLIEQMDCICNMDVNMIKMRMRMRMILIVWR